MVYKFLPWIFVLIVIATAGWLFLPMSKQTNYPLPTTQIMVGSTTLTAEVASTDEERMLGLSGRSSLPEGSAMLFVFEQAGDWGMWMKDMNFPIDIVFISETSDPSIGSVVSVAKDVSPDTYKQQPPETFFPPLAVKYVLELPAGFADAHAVAEGTKIVLQ